MLALVKDDGPGLSESEIDMLFVPFSRLKPGNMKSSNDKVDYKLFSRLHFVTNCSQVSLSAAKQILEVHGAKVGGEGSSGKGTTFYFKIDLAIPTKSEEQTSFLTTEILNVDDMTDAGPGSKRASLKISPGNSSLNLINSDILRRKSHSPIEHPKEMVLESVKDLVAEDAQRSRSPEPVTASTSNPKSAVTDQAEQEAPKALTTPQISHEVAAPVMASVQTKGGKPTALLVDDVKSNRRMYGRILELLGFEVTTAEDGVECLSVVKAATSPFTVILIDHSMVS